MNTKICTSIEQSKKLIELGIDVNTADMCYYYDHNWSNEHIEIPKIWDNNYEQFIPESEEDDIPAWSFSSLLGLIEWDYNLEKTLFDQSDYFTYSIVCDDLDFRTYEYDDPIDAAFEMVCWLKEHNKL